MFIELITEHEHQVPAGLDAGPADLSLRHFSLQYFTSAQLRAHALRQLIGFPQPTHGLLGKAALLPLNVLFNCRRFLRAAGIAKKNLRSEALMSLG